jgi:hypothetical protein
MKLKFFAVGFVVLLAIPSFADSNSVPVNELAWVESGWYILSDNVTAGDPFKNLYYLNMEDDTIMVLFVQKSGGYAIAELRSFSTIKGGSYVQFDSALRQVTIARKLAYKSELAREYLLDECGWW